MTINKTIQKILAVGGLVGMLASSACGEDKDKESCTKDTDCREPRICDSELGYCVDSNGSSGSSSGGSSNPCGNSPLFGKYLWNVAGCEIGSEKPFDKNCKGYITGDSGKENVYDYKGLTLTRLENGYKFTLVRTFSCSDSNVEDPYGTCSEFQCAIAKDSMIYVLMNLDETTRIVDNLFKIKDLPWPGRDACRAQVKTEEGYSCLSDH